MKNTLRKYDDVLTPDERFRLALAAMARDDKAEVHRLHDTCPRHTYIMQDVGFSDRFSKSHAAAMDFIVLWLWSLKQYTEAQLLYAAHDRMIQESSTETTAVELLHLLLRRAKELKGTYMGLLRFCEAARLDWRMLLEWWPPVIEEIESVRTLLDDEEIAAHEEIAAVVLQVLAGAWPFLTDGNARIEGTR